MKKILLIVALLTMLIACQTDNADSNGGTGVAGWESVEPTISNDNYYLISEPGHLAWLSEQPALATVQRSNSKNIRLLSDIDMKDKPFKGIEKFSGIFDGDNKSIKNLNIDRSHNNVNANINDNISAFIKESIGDVTIKYLNLDGGKIVGNNYIGAFVGMVSSNAGEKNTLKIIKSTSNLKLSAKKSSEQGSVVGGFICATDNVNVEITDSVHSGKITTVDTFGAIVGGFIGSTLDGDIKLENVVNNADITNFGTTAGLIGFINSNNNVTVTTNIINSSNTGDITSTDLNILVDPETGSNNYASGIVGESSGTTLNITDTYNSGIITSNSINSESLSYASGLISDDSATSTSITNSYNTGDIIATSKKSSDAGGLICKKFGESLNITNSYNTGDIVSSSSINEYSNFAGGIIASSMRVKSTNITLSYNTGNITNTSNAGDMTGGIIGSSIGDPYTENSSISITHSYNKGDIIGNGRNGGIVGKIYTVNIVSQKTLTIDISKTYNTGKITTGSLDNNIIGGLIGEIKNLQPVTLKATISQSFSYGDVKTAGNNGKAGAIIGEFTETTPTIRSGMPTYANNFWYAPTTPTTDPQTGGTKLTVGEFTSGTKFTGWDIDVAGSAWEILPSAKYPTLKNNKE